MNNQRLQRLPELNNNEFTMALEKHEEFRTRVKRNRNSLANTNNIIRNTAKSPKLTAKAHETSLSYNYATPNHSELKTHDRFKQSLIPKDHIKRVGDEQSTGRFVSGKSVPRSRPTMFWQP